MIDLLLLVQSEVLYVDSLLDLVSSLHGRFLELLSAAQLAYHSCLLNFFRAFSMFSPSLIGTIIILFTTSFC